MHGFGDHLHRSSHMVLEPNNFMPRKRPDDCRFGSSSASGGSWEKTRWWIWLRCGSWGKKCRGTAGRRARARIQGAVQRKCDGMQNPKTTATKRRMDTGNRLAEVLGKIFECGGGADINGLRRLNSNPDFKPKNAKSGNFQKWCRNGYLTIEKIGQHMI